MNGVLLLFMNTITPQSVGKLETTTDWLVSKPLITSLVWLVGYTSYNTFDLFFDFMLHYYTYTSLVLPCLEHEP